MGIARGVEHIRDAEFSCRDDDAVGGLRTGKLVDVGVQLLGVAAEIDGLADEGAGNAEVRIAIADLVGLAAGKARQAERVAQAEALIDLGIDPQLRAVPEPPPEVERDVPGLARSIGIEAVGAAIGRVKGRRVLVDVGGLAVDRPVCKVERGRHRLCEVERGIAQLVIQPGADLMGGEARVEGLRTDRKARGCIPVLRIQVFDFTGPAAADRRFEPGAGGPAKTPPECGLDGSGRGAEHRAGAILRPGKQIIGPGKAAGDEIHPVVHVVSKTPAQRAEGIDRVLVVRRADDGGGKRLAGLQLAWKRRIGFHADDPLRRQPKIIPSGEAAEMAAELRPRIDRAEHFQRAGEIRRAARLGRRPGRVAAR